MMSPLVNRNGCRGLALALFAATLGACEAPEPATGENDASSGSAEPAPSRAEEGVAPAGSNVAASAAPGAGPPPAPSPPKAPAAAPWSVSGYRLVGTEPFWGGTVSPERIVYMTPENQAGERVSVDAGYGPAREIYTGALEGRPFILTLTKGPCSDGMSDKVHAFTATLQVGGETRQGCADPQ
jgi:uncharacterized membrane protein